MSDAESSDSPSKKAPKERSPSFPFIPLSAAIGRLEAFEGMFGRHPTPANKVGLAWEMKPASSQAAQTVAALKAFGLVEYEGTGPGRMTSITEDGRNYLRAQQSTVKQAIAQRVALNPKVIAHYWKDWGRKRPIDAVALDELVLNASFTQSAAETFLRVYDETIAFAGLTDSDSDHAVAEKCEGETPPLPDLKVGDWVSVDAGGQTIFERTRIRAIDGNWVFVEASETGAKMEDVTLLERGKPEGDTPPTLPIERNRHALQENEEMDRFTVDEGVVKISFPSGMTVDSVEELEQFFSLFIKKAKRRAEAGKAPN